MPSIESKLQALQVPPSQILSADGKVVLYESELNYRKSIPLSEVSQAMKDAIVEAEDRRFYEHHGVDFFGIARAVTSRGKQGGGSTITMQLAKRLHSVGERTMSRKLLDMAIAEKMEEEWSKDHILELYLNQVYFGAGAYGIEAAAETYFGKPAAKLGLGESAMLARCVRRPGDETPFIDYDKAEANRNIVLRIMLDDGKITQQQYDQAHDEDDEKRLAPPHRDANGRLNRDPYVVAAVMKELKEQFPSVRLLDGGFKVYTNIDWDMQAAVVKAIHHVVAEHAHDRVNNAAFMLMDGEGRVMALGGGADFKKYQYNTVTQSRRQPGSSFKPFVYATAFALGHLDPNSTISNEKLVIEQDSGEPYVPKNDNGKFGGMVSVRTALAASINVPAVRTIMDVGPNTVVANAHDVFGFTSDLAAVPSLALGASNVSPWEMAQAYSVFMLRGTRATPFLINKVEDSNGNLVGEEEPKLARNVLNATVCDDVNDLLRAVVTGGTGTRAGVVPDARGKTGTTSSNKDAWFCGFANGLVGVGWVGNEQYSKRLKHYVPMPMNHAVFGGTVTAPFWAEVMQAAYDKYKDRFAKAENLDSVPERTATAAKAVPDDLTKGDTAIPIDPSTAPNPDGSPDQKNLPVNGDPAAVTTGPGHGQSTKPDDSLPPPPPDPTLAEPRPIHSPPPPVRTTPRPVVHSAPREVEYVEVEICADSGDLATEYCPETVTRRFVKGRQPRHRCRIHRG